jgi:tRNA (Thr-GGU) A37 N-methylase
LVVIAIWYLNRPSSTFTSKNKKINLFLSYVERIYKLKTYSYLGVIFNYNGSFVKAKELNWWIKLAKLYIVCIENWEIQRWQYFSNIAKVDLHISKSFRPKLFGLHSHWVYLFKEILLSSKTCTAFVSGKHNHLVCVFRRRSINRDNSKYTIINATPQLVGNLRQGWRFFRSSCQSKECRRCYL